MGPNQPVQMSTMLQQLADDFAFMSKDFHLQLFHERALQVFILAGYILFYSS